MFTQPLIVRGYRRPLLFADFLSANSLIYISKLIKNDNFLVKNGLFYLQIQDFPVQNDEMYLLRITRETCIQQLVPMATWRTSNQKYVALTPVVASEALESNIRANLLKLWRIIRRRRGRRLSLMELIKMQIIFSLRKEKNRCKVSLHYLRDFDYSWTTKCL